MKINISFFFLNNTIHCLAFEQTKNNIYNLLYHEKSCAENSWKNSVIIKFDILEKIVWNLYSKIIELCEYSKINNISVVLPLLTPLVNLCEKKELKNLNNNEQFCLENNSLKIKNINYEQQILINDSLFTEYKQLFHKLKIVVHKYTIPPLIYNKESLKTTEEDYCILNIEADQSQFYFYHKNKLCQVETFFLGHNYIFEIMHQLCLNNFDIPANFDFEPIKDFIFTKKNFDQFLQVPWIIFQGKELCVSYEINSDDFNQIINKKILPLILKCFEKITKNLKFPVPKKIIVNEMYSIFLLIQNNVNFQQTFNEIDYIETEKFIEQIIGL